MEVITKFEWIFNYFVHSIIFGFTLFWQQHVHKIKILKTNFYSFP